MTDGVSTVGARVPGRSVARRAIVAVGLSVAVVGLNTTAITVATRGVADELGVTLSTLSWIVSAYLLAGAATAMIGGRLGDVIGRTRTFVAGLLVFACGCALAALAPGSTVLIVARVVQGIGAGMLLPATIEVAVAFAAEGRERIGFRWRGIAYSISFGIGPLVGGVLTDYVSWRAIFWLELGVLLIAGVIAVPLLGHVRTRLPRPRTRDVAGGLLLAVVVVATVLWFTKARVWGVVSWPSAVLVVVAGFAALALVLVERGQEDPLLHPSLIRNRFVVGANLATLGSSVAMLGLLYFFSVYAQSAAVLDSTTLGVALTLLPFGLTIIAFSLLSRWLAGRLGYLGPVVVGLGAAVVGFALLSRVGPGTTREQILFPLALCGVGGGIANAGLLSPAVLSLPRWRLDEAAGLVSLTRFFGSAIAVAIGTATYLSASMGPVPAELPPTIIDEKVAVGGTAYQRAVTALAADLRAPFEAAARAQASSGFARTMLITAIGLGLVTVAAAILLRPGPDDAQPAGPSQSDSGVASRGPEKGTATGAPPSAAEA